MYNINDYVVYKKDVCHIKNIKVNGLTNEKSYVLEPIDDSSLSIDVLITNKQGFLRDIITRDKVDDIINSIPSIPLIDNINDRMIEQKYKKLLNSGTYEDLITIIKTAYMRNNERIKHNKKIGERDDNYFQKAERIIYNEFSIALNLSYDETKKYVIDHVGALDYNNAQI